jgi:hypothetical protein
MPENKVALVKKAGKFIFCSLYQHHRPGFYPERQRNFSFLSLKLEHLFFPTSSSFAIKSF